MKKLVYAIIIAFASSSAFLSCKSDEKVEYSSDCYIKSFVLGGMKRTLHSTTTAGDDTTYSVTLTGSAFPMSINHVEGYITNATALPIGTQLGAVTSTITSQGLVVYAPEADTTTWVQHNSTDSIDFSHPLIFRVIATDGQSYRDYRVTLSVRDNDADKYSWTKLVTADVLARRTSAKMLIDVRGTEDALLPVIISAEAEGNCYVSRAASAQDPAAWEERPCLGLPQTADVNTAVAYDKAFWLSTTDGLLYTSDDAVTWSEVRQDEPSSLTLIAASASSLYATTTSVGSLIIKSSADGIHWQDTPTESAIGGHVVASAAYTQPNGNKRVLIASAADGATVLDTWSLLEEYDMMWNCFSDDELNTYRLPFTQPQSITVYNDRLFAFCGTDILVSDDNGITWQAVSNMSLPVADTAVRTAVSMDEYIYMLCGSQLWRARLNSYGE